MRVAVLRRVVAAAAQKGADVALTTIGDQGTHRLRVTATGNVSPLPPAEEPREAEAIFRRPDPASIEDPTAAAPSPTPAATPLPARRSEVVEEIEDRTELSRRRKDEVPIAVLVLDSGAQVRVEAPGIIGRVTKSTLGRTSIWVEDPTHTMSRAHAWLEPTAEGLVVVDLGSANGTAIDSAGTVEELKIREARVVGDGTRLLLGDLPVTVRLLTAGKARVSA